MGGSKESRNQRCPFQFLPQEVNFVTTTLTSLPSPYPSEPCLFTPYPSEPRLFTPYPRKLVARDHRIRLTKKTFSIYWRYTHLKNILFILSLDGVCVCDIIDKKNIPLYLQKKTDISSEGGDS